MVRVRQSDGLRVGVGRFEPSGPSRRAFTVKGETVDIGFLDKVPVTCAQLWYMVVNVVACVLWVVDSATRRYRDDNGNLFAIVVKLFVFVQYPRPFHGDVHVA